MGRRTYYARSFPDGRGAEVLFVVPGRSRETAVNETIAEWRKAREPFRIQCRALTRWGALGERTGLIGFANREDRRHHADSSSAAASPAPNDIAH